MGFPKPAKDLSLRYDDAELREVGAFVRNTEPREGDDLEWLYHSRGSVTDCYQVLTKGSKPGFIGGLSTFPPADVRLILDQPSWGDRDSKDLCWGGPSMTVQDFLDWYGGQS